MAVIRDIGSTLYHKRRPKRYKARDGAYPVGGNKGRVLAFLPGDYPMTSQQAKIKSVAADCGIKPGISKADLMTKMKECVGPKLRK